MWGPRGQETMTSHWVVGEWPPSSSFPSSGKTPHLWAQVTPSLMLPDFHCAHTWMGTSLHELPGACLLPAPGAPPLAPLLHLQGGLLVGVVMDLCSDKSCHQIRQPPTDKPSGLGRPRLRTLLLHPPSMWVPALREACVVPYTSCGLWVWLVIL